jgi:hypothetical protein
MKLKCGCDYRGQERQLRVADEGPHLLFRACVGDAFADDDEGPLHRGLGL